MVKVNLTCVDVLRFVVLGLKNGNYLAVLNLAEEYLDAIEKEGVIPPSSNSNKECGNDY